MRLFTLFTVVFLMFAISLATAGEMRQVKAIGVAETALRRAIAVGSDQIIPKHKLRDAVPGDLYPVHHPRTLEPAYGIVPILSPDGTVVGLIGVDASSSKPIWYSFSPRTGAFPPVSSRTARRRVQMQAGPAGQQVQTAEPVLVSGGDKHLYWRFETGSGEAIYVDSDRQDAEILRSRDGSSEKVTAASISAAKQKVAPSEVHAPASSTPVPVLTNGVRPAAYDIPGVPYHYQITDDYCGCAAVQMALDYHGEEIPQEDVADVIKYVLGDYSIFNDAGKAMSFSPMSISKNDPTLQGYNERELGYANLSYNFVPNTKEERRAALKDLVLTNHPAIIGGWYDALHNGGHWRLLKGYDDSLNVFIFHDPYYTGGFNGPNLLIDQELWLDDLWDMNASWNYQARIAVPWVLTTDFPGTVSQGDTFTVDLKVVYPGLLPGPGQNPTHDGTASIALSGGLTLAGGAATVSMASIASGDSTTISWDVIASGAPGEWGMGLAAKGIIDYWAYSYGTSSDSIGDHSYEVVEITSTLAADWDSEERLTNDDLSSETCVPHARSMAVEDNGTTHIVWQDLRAGGGYIRYMKQAGGTWQTPVELTPEGVFCHSPCVAVDPDGGVHVAYARKSEAGKLFIYYMSWTSAGGWSAEELVSNVIEVECFPCIAADDSLVHIAWEKRLSGLYRAHAVFHSFRDALGWSVPVDVDASAARDSFRPSLAVGADGLLHIVYERHTSNDPVELEKVVHKSWDGIVWSGRTGLSSGLSHARTPSIAAGDDGTLHVVWRDGENLGGDIFYSMFDGIAWQVVPSEIVTGATEACTPSVAVDANGVVYVVWVDYRHSESEIYLMENSLVEIVPGVFVRLWSSASRFTDAIGHSMLPCVCATGDGSVSVLWTDLRHGSPEIYYRGPDAGSGVLEDPEALAGTLLKLSLPRPQPFMHDVRLSLTVGKAADVLIDVFDINGRVVRSLVHGRYEPGSYDISWDGTAASQERVSPGVYFISCKSGMGEDVQRVVMVR